MTHSARTTHLLTSFACLLALLSCVDTGGASPIYQDVNESFNPGPYYWAPPTGKIGWYWTPETDVELQGIQTKLTTGFWNLNNNFTFTTTLYDERPAAGGNSLGSFNWNGAAYIDGPWLGGTFANPLELKGGHTYFIGMSGWEQGLAYWGSGGGSGVNWIDPAGQPGSETLGAGSGYMGADYEIQMNTSGVPANIDSPILRFVGVPIPEPSTLALLSVGGLALIRRRRTRVA